MPDSFGEWAPLHMIRFSMLQRTHQNSSARPSRAAGNPLGANSYLRLWFKVLVSFVWHDVWACVACMLVASGYGPLQMNPPSPRGVQGRNNIQDSLYSGINGSLLWLYTKSRIGNEMASSTLWNCNTIVHTHRAKHCISYDCDPKRLVWPIFFDAILFHRCSDLAFLRYSLLCSVLLSSASCDSHVYLWEESVQNIDFGCPYQTWQIWKLERVDKKEKLYGTTSEHHTFFWSDSNIRLSCNVKLPLDASIDSFSYIFCEAYKNMELTVANR